MRNLLSAYAHVCVELVTVCLGKAETAAYLVFSVDSDLSLLLTSCLFCKLIVGTVNQHLLNECKHWEDAVS